MTTTTQPTYPATFAEAEALLAQRLPGYEVRPPQQVGAAAVEKAMVTGRHALIQAPPGIGKTLMTLIPAITAGRRVVISTHTKVLQNQVSQKDVPFLTENVMPFKWALIKGRSNYLCSRKAPALVVGDPIMADVLEAAAVEGFSGLREDLGFEVPDRLWAEICSVTEDCNDLGCKQLSGCFAQVARNRAAAADVVIVNHALLTSNLLMAAEFDFSMLGDLDIVIIDEAHCLAEATKSNLGSELSEGSINSLLAQVHNIVDDYYTPSRTTEAVEVARANFYNEFSMLWMDLSRLIPARETKLRLVASVVDETTDSWERTFHAAEEFAARLGALGSTGDAKANNRLRSLKRRAHKIVNGLHNIIMLDPATARWLEVRANRRGKSQVVLCSEPLDVSGWLADNLFDRATVICTSGTLKIAGKFDFVAGEIGCTIYDATDVGTMFDYPTQGRICIPTLPEPSGKERSAWEAAVPSTILKAILASKGRALVLFTSNDMLRKTWDAIADEIPYPIRRQGDAATPVLAAWFKENIDSVLFATRSFFTGFDAPGETCSLVILDKLVFNSPSDPVEEAMDEYLRSQGRNTFAERSLPTMILDLQQAAGRLLRTTTDRGVFLLLDNRVFTKGYGSTVLKSLPPMPLIKTAVEIEEFLGG